MNGIKIVGTGMYVPEKIATNADFEKIVDTSDEWITTRTGISQRHVTNGEPTWYLGAMAAKNAIKNAGIEASEIGLIIVTTVSPDFSTPSVACIIQREIGAIGCPAFDMNAACSGFVFAVDNARRYLCTDDSIKYALVVSAENLTKYVDYSDRTTCILFGDGAAATVITRADTLYSSYIGADGNGACHLFARSYHANNIFTDATEEFEDGMGGVRNGHFFVQNGQEVYKFATKAMPSAVQEACKKAGITTADLDMVVPHQANIRIIKTAMKSMGVADDKVYVNIARYGNTSSASIPLALHEAVQEGKITKGDKVCLVGFGAGLTYGALIFEF